MSTLNRIRADSVSDSFDDLEQDVFDLLRLEEFEKHINVGETTDTTGPEAVEVKQKEESQDPAEVKTDLFGAAVAPATQAEPETERNIHDDEDHDGDDFDHNDEEVASPQDGVAEVHSDQAPRAPIHAADIEVTDCLEDIAMLGQVMGTHHTVAMEGAGVPVLGEELCDERVPGQEREVAAREGAGVTVLGKDLCDERVLGKEKEGKVYDVIRRADEGSEAVLDVAVKGIHADRDNSKVVLNGHMKIDSVDGLDLAADKHGDGDAHGDADGDIEIEGGRSTDGDRAEGGKHTVDEGLCGTGVETDSTKQGTDQANQARAPHAGNIGANNDARVRGIYYERRLQNLEKNMELVLANKNTTKGRASRTQQTVPDVNVATPNGGDLPRRSDNQGLQEHPFIQELQRFFILVVCCTAVIIILSRRGIISLSPVDSGLHPVHGRQSEPFNPLEKAMVTISERDEKPGHEGYEGGKPLPAKKMKHVEFFGDMQRWELVLDVDGVLWMCVVDRDDTETLCQGVAEDVSVGAVDLLDKKGDKVLNVTIKVPPSRKWWNLFAVFWKQPLGVKVTNGSARKSKDDGHISKE